MFEKAKVIRQVKRTCGILKTATEWHGI